jgi:hypothetical protein
MRCSRAVYLQRGQRPGLQHKLFGVLGCIFCFPHAAVLDVVHLALLDVPAVGDVPT